MSPRQFHAIMSALMLIAFYLSDRSWVLGIASIFWACLYVLDISLAIQTLINEAEKDEDN